VVKVLIATDVTVAGGVDVYVRDLAVALVGVGHEPELLVERTSRSMLLNDDSSIPVHRIRLHHRTHSQEAIAEDVSALLATMQPGGVHVVCGVPWSCLALRRRAADLGIPMLLTEQYVPENLMLTPSQRAEVEWSYGVARRVVFVSEGNRRRMAREVSLVGVAVEVIPNAVPVGAIARRSLAATERADRLRRRAGVDALHVLTAARLFPEKGVDDLIAAVALLAPGTTRLTVLGDGPLRGELERQAAALAVDARFAGWWPDVVGELRGADVFVLASHHEGMPFSVLEAMAAGVPVVATSTPGSAEALEHGRAGLLVAPGDRGALADALVAVRTDPEAALGRAAAGLDVVARSHDRPETMKRTVAIWHDQHR
jgi:glycosyltransferase involved in cell wall biosynthesis